MPIVVTDSVQVALRPEATVVLVVRSPFAVVLRAAVQTALAEIAALDGGWTTAMGLSARDRNGPKYVSPAVPVPGGVLLMVDAGSTPAAKLATIPDILTRALEAAGVGDASIEIPPQIEGLEWLTGPAVRAWLRGPGDLTRPGTWFADVAGPWLRSYGDAPTGIVMSAQIPLTWDTLPDVANEVLGAGQTISVTVGETAWASVSAANEAALTLAGDSLAEAMRLLREALRPAASRLVWAGIDVVPDARFAMIPRWYSRDRPPIDFIGDVAVPDGMWWQILSGGHLARLGGPPPGGVALDGGRYELAVGEPYEWMPEHPDRPLKLTEARRLLAPCVLDPEEVRRLSLERLGDLPD